MKQYEDTTNQEKLAIFLTVLNFLLMFLKAGGGECCLINLLYYAGEVQCIFVLLSIANYIF